MSRRFMAGVAAACSIAIGLAVRGKALAWSSNIAAYRGEREVTIPLDPRRLMLLHDVGALLIAFGTLLFVVLMAQWIATEPKQRPESTP